MKTELFSNDASSLKKAALFLSADEVVALPTETVDGLAGNAFSPAAIEKIFKAKERPFFDPLIVHISQNLLQKNSNPLLALIDAEILSSEILSWPSASLIQSAFQKFWPGPLTFVLPRGNKIPDGVTSGQDTVGIRCPAHPTFQAVLSELDFPLAAPSANRFGRISPTDAKHVQQELDGRIAAIVDGGPCRVGVESTIIRIEDEIEGGLKATLLRPGKISSEALSKHFGTTLHSAQALGQKNQVQVSPGMLDQHYAPKKPLYLVPHSFLEIQKTIDFLKLKNITGKIAFLGTQSVPDLLQNSELKKLEVSTSITLSKTNSLDEMAQNLFASLRALDKNEAVDVIVADIPEDHQQGLGAAIVDRLNRASLNKPFLP